MLVLRYITGMIRYVMAGNFTIGRSIAWVVELYNILQIQYFPEWTHIEHGDIVPDITIAPPITSSQPQHASLTAKRVLEGVGNGR